MHPGTQFAIAAAAAFLGALIGGFATYFAQKRLGDRARKQDLLALMEESARNVRAHLDQLLKARVFAAHARAVGLLLLPRPSAYWQQQHEKWKHQITLRVGAVQQARARFVGNAVVLDLLCPSMTGFRECIRAVERAEEPATPEPPDGPAREQLDKWRDGQEKLVQSRRQPVDDLVWECLRLARAEVVPPSRCRSFLRELRRFYVDFEHRLFRVDPNHRESRDGRP